MKKEIWKPVVGFEGLYEISNIGRVKSKHKFGRPAKDGILSLQKNHKGYLRVHLSGYGKGYTVVVHRLVLEAFVSPQPSVIHESNHKNGIKSDNRKENLEWVTPKENNRHSVENGFWHPHKGEAHGMAKLKAIDIPTIRADEGQESAYKIAKRYGVKPQTIYSIWKRRLWKHIPEEK